MGPTSTQKPLSQPGLLLVGHGTRNPHGQAELLETARLVADHLDEMPVEPAFLELSEPTIAEGIKRLVALGIDQLTVSPLLLFAAGHAKTDIPRAVSQALEPFPQVSVNWASPFACHAKILKLSALRYRQAISSADQLPRDETLLVMVGRGSSDSQAIAQMHQFSRLRASSDRLSQLETCFFAKAEPSLTEMLERAAGHRAHRVVVQPHLLFQGHLTESLSQQVQSMASAHPEKQWIVAQHLGPHEILVQATRDIVGSALQQSV